VYQRTAPWVIPKPDRVFSTLEKTMLKLPFYRRGFRRFLFLMHELRVLAFLGNPRAQKIGKRLAVNHMNKQISDPVLRRKLTPDYTIGCKRLMISNDYYPALTRKNVELITSGITEIRAHSIIDAAGQERPVDAIILGTGFQVTQAYRHIAITGLGGQRLGDLWDRTGMEAYNGIAIAGFPNYFMLLGPHTALGHNSVVIMIEAQVNYIVDALKKLRAAGGAAISGCAAPPGRMAAAIAGTRMSTARSPPSGPAPPHLINARSNPQICGIMKYWLPRRQR
jgi:cation diffusion facilitator CzcD-associated flavoprotein CzcO